MYKFPPNSSWLLDSLKLHGEQSLEEYCFLICVETDECNSFVFEALQGLNATLLPIYSGKLLVRASNGDILAVPYQGIGFSLSEEPENMSVGTYPWLRAGFPPTETIT